jgi:hypothetical protein
MPQQELADMVDLEQHATEECPPASGVPFKYWDYGVEGKFVL